mgnify:CR=1 FL=1
MTHTFYIAHTTSGRTRIRWAGDASDKASIRQVAENIAAIEGVDQALPRITTGSIIIEHDQAEWSDLEPQITDRLSVEITVPQSRSGLALLNHELDKVDNTLKGINTDLPSVTVLLLIMLAITQALRGQVTGNSMSFLWYALSIASRTRGRAGVGTLDTSENVSE